MQKKEGLKTPPRSHASHASCFMLHASCSRGFGLTELLVSLAIITLIMAVVLVGYRQSQGGLTITNLAYDVALAIRQAQVFGISAQSAAYGGSRTTDTGYGIRFDRGSPKSFTLFADFFGTPPAKGDHRYGSGEFVKTFSIGRGNRVQSFCAIQGGTRHCSSSVSYLDIVFERPNPDAYFTTSAGRSYERAEIVLVSPNGLTRTVEVLKTGQISIK